MSTETNKSVGRSDYSLLCVDSVTMGMLERSNIQIGHIATPFEIGYDRSMNERITLVDRSEFSDDDPTVFKMWDQGRIPTLTIEKVIDLFRMGGYNINSSWVFIDEADGSDTEDDYIRYFPVVSKLNGWRIEDVDLQLDAGVLFMNRKDALLYAFQWILKNDGRYFHQ